MNRLFLAIILVFAFATQSYATQRTRSTFQSTDIPTIGDSGENTASEVRTLITNLSDSAAFGADLRPAIASARYLVPHSYGGLSNTTMTLNRIYLTPVHVAQSGVYTDFGLSTVAVTAASYKVGIYADSNGVPTGNPIAGSTGTIGPFTTASATNQTYTFSSPLTLNTGMYWLAAVTDVSGTVTNISNTGQPNLFGAPDMTSGNGAIVYYSSTYASGLVDLTGVSLTYSSGTGSFYYGLKKQ